MKYISDDVTIFVMLLKYLSNGPNHGRQTRDLSVYPSRLMVLMELLTASPRFFNFFVHIFFSRKIDLRLGH